MDEFEAITADLWSAQRQEHEDQAREVLAASDAETRFSVWLRRLPRGEVVALVTIDGATLRGRVLRVGQDWIRLGEVADDGGTQRTECRRDHAVRMAAIVRLSRESGR